MNQSGNRKKYLIKQTAILGFITMIVLVNLIGDLGIAYFAAAFELYILVQILIMEYVPDCVEKLIRSRIAKGQYKNADKVLIAALWYCFVAGILGSLLLFFLSDFLTGGILHIPESSFVLKLLAPVFFFMSISAVLQGYFQGIGTAMPTVISGIMKQVFGLFFITLFGSIFYRYGEKASALLQNSKFINMYGAAGAALGILCAVILPVAFLLLIYLGAGRRARYKMKEGMRLSESVSDSLRLLLLSMFPASGIYFLSRSVIVIGLGLYRNNQTDMIAGLTAYGAFYGKYLMLAGLLISIVLLVSGGVEYTVVNTIKTKEYKSAKNYLTAGIQSVYMLASFFAMLCFVLAPGLMKILFGDIEGSMSIICMQHGFLLILFLPMGIYFSRILAGIGKRNMTLISLICSVAVFIITAVICLKSMKGSVLALVYALLLFALVYTLLSGFFLAQKIRYYTEWMHILISPSAAVIVSGLCTFLLNRALVLFAGETLATILSLFIGGISYFILIFVFHCVREKDLYLMPGGNFLFKIGRLLHLL